MARYEIWRKQNVRRANETVEGSSLEVKENAVVINDILNGIVEIPVYVVPIDDLIKIVRVRV